MLMLFSPRAIRKCVLLSHATLQFNLLFFFFICKTHASLSTWGVPESCSVSSGWRRRASPGPTTPSRGVRICAAGGGGSRANPHQTHPSLLRGPVTEREAENVPSHP